MGAAAALILAGCGEVSSSVPASHVSSNGSVPTSSAVSSIPASSVVSSSVETGPTAITAADLVAWNAEQDKTLIVVDADTIFTTSGIMAFPKKAKISWHFAIPISKALTVLKRVQ